MKILITKTRNMFRKLSGQTTVEIEGTGWKQNATTKEMALALLQERLKLQQENMYCRRYLQKNRTTFALYYCDGRAYDIISPDASKYSSCLLSDKTFTSAYQRMYSHWEQYEN